jgi:hypothetical protein
MTPRWRRLGCVALLAVMACYEMRSTSVRLRVPNTRLDCVDTTNRIFSEAGFVRLGTAHGPGLFYVPQTNPRMGLQWGIGVAIEAHNDYRDQNRCDFELQALSPDESCGLQCPLTPQPGADYDRAVNELARKLAAAFGERLSGE